MFYESKVDVVGVNAEEVGLYLAINRTEEELEREGISQFCQTRKTNIGRHPVITGSILQELKRRDSSH